VSDWNSPATTTVMPPATGGQPPAPPSTGTPMPPDSRGKVPVWLLVVLVLAAALVTGLVVYLLAGGQSGKLETEITALQAQNTELEKQVGELTKQVASAEASAAAAASAAASAAAALEPEDTTATTTGTEKQFAFVTKMAWSAEQGYTITVDYAQMLTGKDAAAAAAAHGDESPPPNDYYILNDNKKLRTFAVSKSAVIVVLGWGGTDATAKKTIPVGQFLDVVKGGASPQEPWMSAPYTVTITKGTVTRVEQFYLP